MADILSVSSIDAGGDVQWGEITADLVEKSHARLCALLMALATQLAVMVAGVHGSPIIDKGQRGSPRLLHPYQSFSNLCLAVVPWLRGRWDGDGGWHC
jgi:hypothetical protein